MADVEALGNTSSQEDKENDGVTWWCKVLVQVIGVVAAFISIIAAIPNLLSITSPLSIISGVLMIVNGVLLLIFEAPLCCQFLEITKPMAAWIKRRKYWQKGVIYLILAVTPLIPSRSIFIILGCLPVFVTGTFYGLLSIGKKADRSEMMANAKTNGNKYQPFENTN